MSFELSDEEGKSLINLARSAVETFLKTGQTLKLPKDVSQKFYEKCGVFVTISMLDKGEKVLRGCIGYPYPSRLLVEAVIDSAISAAVKNPRFLPMSFDELDGRVFEVRNCAEITCDQKTELHELSAKIIAYYFRTVP
jgi:uncharacterized protein (TIGR00296 family)